MQSSARAAVTPRGVGLVVAGALMLGSGIAAAQTCGPTQQTIGWSQPNKVPISSENAVRWPTDSSLRIAYGGPWCVNPDQIELLDEEGNAVPAQVRVHTPFTLVTNSPQPLTVMEIDPIPTLETRSDYRLVVRPPDPALSANREFTLEFRTSGSEAPEFPDFEGILDVQLDGRVCDENGSFEGADNNNPACPIPNLLRVVVTFQPVNRADVAYIIYRTSTTPVDENGDPIPDMADNTPIPLQYENGARDLFGAGIPERPVRIRIPYFPLPRQDCFSVRALDEWGRERGDLSNEACIILERIDPCPDYCPMQLCMPPFPEPNPFEASPPIAGQVCDNLGLAGAEPDREVPPVGEPEPDPPGGSDGGVAGDGGASDGGETSGGGGGGSAGCRVGAPAGGSAPWLALLLLAPALRRRRG